MTEADKFLREHFHQLADIRVGDKVCSHKIPTVLRKIYGEHNWLSIVKHEQDRLFIAAGMGHQLRNTRL